MAETTLCTPASQGGTPLPAGWLDEVLGGYRIGAGAVAGESGFRAVCITPGGPGTNQIVCLSGFDSQRDAMRGARAMALGHSVAVRIV